MLIKEAHYPFIIAGQKEAGNNGQKRPDNERGHSQDQVGRRLHQPRGDRRDRLLQGNRQLLEHMLHACHKGRIKLGHGIFQKIGKDRKRRQDLVGINRRKLRNQRTDRRNYLRTRIQDQGEKHRVKQDQDQDSRDSRGNLCFSGDPKRRFSKDPYDQERQDKRQKNWRRVF